MVAGVQGSFWSQPPDQDTAAHISQWHPCAACPPNENSRTWSVDWLIIPWSGSGRAAARLRGRASGSAVRVSMLAVSCAKDLRAGWIPNLKRSWGAVFFKDLAFLDGIKHLTLSLQLILKFTVGVVRHYPICLCTVYRDRLIKSTTRPQNITIQHDQISSRTSPPVSLLNIADRARSYSPYRGISAHVLAAAT